MRELGEVTFTRIEIAPFAFERFGTTFGLIARPGKDEDAAWRVRHLSVEPGLHWGRNPRRQVGSTHLTRPTPGQKSGRDVNPRAISVSFEHPAKSILN